MRKFKNLMIICLFSLSAFAQINSQKAYDDLHSSHMTFPFPNKGKELGTSFFGYGYLKTEIQADENIELACREENKISLNTFEADYRVEQSLYYKSMYQLIKGESIDTCVEINLSQLDSYQSAKYQRLKQMLGINYTLKAFFWYHYQLKKMNYYCFENIDEKRCHKNKSVLYKVMLSHPVLFAGENQESLIIFKNKVIELVGNLFESDGEDVLNNAFKFLNSDSTNINKFLTSFNSKIHEQLSLESEELFLDLYTHYETMQMGYARKIEELVNSCNRLNINSLVLKQYIADKAQLSNEICQSDIYTELLDHSLFENRTVECSKYDKLESNGVESLADKRINYEQAGDVLKIQVNVPFKINPAVLNVYGVAAVEQRLEEWEQLSQNYYKCQFGEIESFSYVDQNNNSQVVNCSKNYYQNTDIKFNFFIDDKHVFPINLHLCFSNDAPRDKRTSCDELYQIKIEQCLNNNSESYCYENIKPDSYQLLTGRVNAANYTYEMSNKTLIHEVGHFLGLRDEYPSMGLWNIDLNGGFPSIMSNLPSMANLHEFKLLPRHTREILSIKRCFLPREDSDINNEEIESSSSNGPASESRFERIKRSASGFFETISNKAKDLINRFF